MVAALTVAIGTPPRYFRSHRQRFAEWGDVDTNYVLCFADERGLYVVTHLTVGVKHDAVIASELAAGTNTGCVSVNFACELAADALRGEAPLMPPVGWAESDE